MTVPLVPPKVECRAAARRIFHGRVDIQLADHQLMVGQGIDISSSGLALQGLRNLAAGTPCKVQFSLMLHDGSRHLIILLGVIVNSALCGNCGTFRLGIQFYSVPAPYRETLHQYMAAHTTSGRAMTAPPVPPKAECRGAARCIFHGPIDIQLADHQLMVGHGIDISSSGLALHGPRNLAAGTRCKVQFSLKLHDGALHSIILAGVIVNSAFSGENGTFRLGIQFCSVSDPYRETLHQYMAAHPTSGRELATVSSLTPKGSELALEAMAAGAMAVVGKPRTAFPAADLSDARAATPTSVGRANVRAVLRPRETPVPRPPVLARTTHRVLAIGASTGGTTALEDLLRAMPPDLPGTVVSQHMPELFTGSFARRLAKEIGLDVREAQEGDPVVPGKVLIAPGNRHLLLVRFGDRYQVSISDGPAVNRHRPSVDVMFTSVAKAAGRNAIGVILTGMGRDGAQGLLEMRQAGAFTIAQDEASCVVFGMPKAAIDIDAVDEVVSLTKIPGRLVRLFNNDTGEKT
ncbi:MAG: chemotaxis protein CheB [Azonexus sp.]